MKTKQIFLASSEELKADRKEFEILISRKNKEWVDRGVYLRLAVWEDFLDAVSKTRLQDEYNSAVVNSDIFVMLFFTKVGEYTEEEFDTALRQFQATKTKPLIFTYFKESGSAPGDKAQTSDSVIEFQKKLSAIGHFYTVYPHIDSLKFHFNQQLDKLAAIGFIELGSAARVPFPPKCCTNLLAATAARATTAKATNASFSQRGTTQTRRAAFGMLEQLRVVCSVIATASRGACPR